MLEEVSLECPHCGEPAVLEVDTSAGGEQSYYEDCAVCCKPMAVRVRCRPGEVLGLSVGADD